VPHMMGSLVDHGVDFLFRHVSYLRRSAI
jgi:hypothetical protein